MFEEEAIEIAEMYEILLDYFLGLDCLKDDKIDEIVTGRWRFSDEDSLEANDSEDFSGRFGRRIYWGQDRLTILRMIIF